MYRTDGSGRQISIPGTSDREMQKMDKYEFNIKVEQIKKMAARNDYETAMKIADTIDWRRVRNVNILSMVANIYEKNDEFQEAKDILLLAFERAPIGKRLLFKLAELAIKEGSLQEAEDYYREFCDLSPDDPRQYILRYLILGAKGAPVEQLIHTLEQYCNIELDEKWIYELAELYAEANMGDLCIMTCDKIMLMFGLGKYVEKAMELKIQFAPLTKYQMDLVENRDKYEAKLKAVEQEYRMGAPAADSEEFEDREVSAPSYMAREEASFTREPGYPEDEYSDESYPEEGYAGEGYAEDRYSEDGYPQEGYAEDGYTEDGYTESTYQGQLYTGGNYAEDQYEDGDYLQEGYSGRRDLNEGYEPQYQEGGYGENYEEDDPEAYGEQRAPVTIEPEDPGMEEEFPEEGQQNQWIPEEPSHILSEEAVRAGFHEAEVQANLAMEMSRISKGGHVPEQTFAQTRVLPDIRDLTKEPVRRAAHHLMVEAEDPALGLEQAVELLKKIHKETGAKNQAAKISGEKLNSKGLFSIADKLTGKDFIVEYAGVMEESILQELNQLMARDETGMNVVLIDGAAGLARIYKVYPGLAKRFEYVGGSKPGEGVLEGPEHDGRPVRQVQVRSSEETVAKKVRKQPEELPSKPVAKRQAAPAQSAPVQPVLAQSAPVQSAPAQPAPVQSAPAQPAPARSVPAQSVRMPVQADVPAAPPSLKDRNPGERHTEPVKPSRVKRETRPEMLGNAPAPAQPVQEEPEYDDEAEMDIDEFAKYACQYASDIDCSISGKSMLALYERIEIMEEDGVPLSRVNAEDLIEEAADKAENPSFMKRLTGIFSSRYDREGLLILKEEHFI